MNDRKICIILNTNISEEIKKLNIPNGFEIEIRKIIKCCNIAKAYNKILDTSDAKYKIYINKVVDFENDNILLDILNIFLQNNKIGMIGILGAETIPTSGIWQKSIHKCGKCYKLLNSNKKDILEYNIIQEKYRRVKVIDGSFIATQYDVRWREDLFNDIYFYDTSQCIEFMKLGYEIVVPSQNKPWCVLKDYDFSNMSQGYKKYNKIFLQEYSNNIFPLVSILIPAYNRAEFFKIAVESAINQSYRNIEVVICDDSTNDEVENVIKPYLCKYKNIKYYNNGGPLGEKGLKNSLKCLKLCRGEFVNFLFDDDVFSKIKIEKMMNYYIEYNNIIFVTSNRELIDSNGRILPKDEYNKCLFNKDTIVDGNKIAKYIIKNNMVNIVGEMTTVLLRKKDLENSYAKCFDYQCKSLVDLGKWLELLYKGKIVYISEVLSYFRQHEMTNTNDPNVLCEGIIDYFNIISQLYKRKLYFRNEKEFLRCLANYYKTSLVFLKRIKDDNTEVLLRKNVYECIDNAIKRVLYIENIMD